MQEKPLHTQWHALNVCYSFLIKGEYLIQVARHGLLIGLNSHNLWWKALKVHYRREKLLISSFGRQLHLASIPFILINHPTPIQNNLLYGNEEWIITTSREYTTCLALITYRALNEKIYEETPSCHNLEPLNWIGRKYLWCGQGRQKAALTVKCDTHLAPVDNVVPVPAVVIHYIDVIQVGVCPVHQLLDHVQCHSSGLLNFIIHQPRPVGAIHVAALHLGHIPIVGEKEHSAEGWSVQMIKFWKLSCLLCLENKV